MTALVSAYVAYLTGVFIRAFVWTAAAILALEAFF